MRSPSENTTTATFNPEKHTGLVFDFYLLVEQGEDEDEDDEEHELEPELALL